MKWVNHILIGGACAAIFNPSMVPVVVLGATAPDWIETVSNNYLGTHIRHRQETHYPVIWLLGIGFALLLWDYHNILFWFCIGGLSHCLTDAMTVTGIPLGPWSDEFYDQGLISGKEWKENRFKFF